MAGIRHMWRVANGLDNAALDDNRWRFEVLKFLKVLFPSEERFNL